MTEPTRKQIRRWQRYLANERAEAAVYRELALSKEGPERDILLAIADAESRHEEHWRKLLGNHVGMPQRPDFSTRFMGFMAKRFGSVFTLALMQAAESRTPYAKDEDATQQMIADERIHAEVVRGLAERGREQMSGNFRAAVFGANDGLVSNLALVLGVLAAGVDNRLVLLTGISGLLSGALSMGAGEYVSVCSQRELLEASTPNPETSSEVPRLDVDANELALVYRARGMSTEDAEQQAQAVFAELKATGMISHSPIGNNSDSTTNNGEETDVVGSGWSAAASSFMFFGTGALIPVIPFFFGLSPLVAGVLACVLVGIALLCTGGIVGVLSGASPWKRGLRQLAIGMGAAAVTYGLGRAFGVAVG
ncbi:VIT1/CCC1 transporter family protein [Corynebacterium freiburgense]|uniref:VIT1/CCC1 transporter family protein n=1 Tax=Corynebacterium freiburgense TaxID=556548 RepID=UPI00040FF6C8|nr:VIT1/CCC1 transporter family protein [Corynebacterium freiburgense]WJZ03300.1 VIT family protein [Corynebacterium freiburgense]